MDYRDVFPRYVESQELSPQEAADAWDAIAAFEGWLAAMSQPAVLSRTAVLKYRAELVAQGAELFDELDRRGEEPPPQGLRAVVAHRAYTRGTLRASAVRIS